MLPGERIQSIDNTKIAIQKGNDLLKTYGIKKAKTEMLYRQALRKEILKLKYEEKLPVSLIHDLARGEDRVSKLRLERDVAVIEYETCKYSLKGLETSLEGDRSVLTWDKLEFKNS